MVFVEEVHMWSVIVRMDDTGNWYRNGERFPTREAAIEYAHNQYQLHSTIKEWKVVPVPKDTNNIVSGDR